ncbi:MAG: hypothetical protein ACO1RX_07615 [Candidatus Sericytochromatia bacterium]
MSVPWVYGRGFFDLQWHFAETVSALSGHSLAFALLHYTNFYIRFGLGRDFNPQHPLWQAYLTGLHETPDPQDWTYRFYLAHQHLPAEPRVTARFGCFAYAVSVHKTLRLHFRHANLAEPSSLGRAYQCQRRAELHALFDHVRAHQPPDLQVQGLSWLYHVPAYRRLFPDAYLASAQTVPARFHSLALWGQFLNRHGGLRDEAVRPFLAHLREQADTEALGACFPLPVLSLSAPLAVFAEAYRADA